MADVAESVGVRRLRVLGPMRLESNGQAEAVPRGDAQRLLALLAVHPTGGVRRETITDTLWPDAGRRSRRALADTVYRVKHQLGPAIVVADADTLSLSADLTVDVHEFDRWASSEDRAELERAVDLYDELAPGVYDDWAAEHRRARHAAAVDVFRRLTSISERLSDLDATLSLARRWTAVEPLDEEAHRLVLRTLGRQRRFGEAEAHFQHLRTLLVDELGVEPTADTIAVATAIAAERDVAAIAPTRQQSKFVGREHERAVTLEAVEAAVAGTGTVLCVEGPGGIGKTRLLGELMHSARWRGATVAAGEVHDVPESSALASLARVLDVVLTPAVRVEIESRLGPVALGTIGALHPEWRTDRGMPASVAPDRVAAALRVVGSILAEAGPLVVVVDDVHRATASTWDHLAALAEGLVPGGGLLALGYRRPEIESSPGWPIVQGWERRSLATIVALAPLTRADVARLVADTTLVADEVYAASGGVPFAVGEVLTDRDRAVDGDIATLIHRRLDGLTGADRRALEAAAVLGDRVSSRIWCETLATSPLELAAIGARLVGARWLTATTDGNAFVHDNLRSAVYEQIDDGQVVAWHERAATAIAAHEPSNARALAYHFDRAGRAREAARAHRVAGRHLRREAAYSEALDSWQRTLELLPHRARRTRLEVGLEYLEVCDIIGGRAEQAAVLDDVVDDARRLHDDRALLRALLIAGGAAARGGDVAVAEKSLAEARELAGKLGDQAALADAAYRTADLLIQSGRWPEGRQAFAAARELVDPDGDRLLHGRILRGLAISSVRTGRPREAIGWLEAAVAAYRDADDTLNELVTATNLPMAYYEVGDWDRMVAAAETVLPLARRLGDETNVGIAHHALALGAHAVGDRSTATARALDAEACWTASGRRRLVGIGINLRALISEDDGEVDAALRLYREALAIAQETNAATEAAYASHDLGALLVRVGRADEALPLLRDAVAHWTETGYPLQRAKSEAVVGLALLDLHSPPVPEAAALADAGLALLHTGDTIGEHPQVWLSALARLLDRLDRHHDRVDVLAAARDELLRQAATIADPQRRRGFFELVPVNAAIVEASQAEQTTPMVTNVRLASVTAPLGRALRPDEYVDVTWTVDLPDDELTPAGAPRRHARLKRLLAEANDQGAAPTDEALAAALGVSRRTIIRDLATLGDTVAATRRRAATRR